MNIVKWQTPTLANWPSLGRLSDLRDEIDRFFDSPFPGLTRTSDLLAGWTPALDVYEDKDSYTVKAELPGMKKEDIEVSLHEGLLSISGERKSEAKKEDAEVYRSERFVGRFQRTVTLPAPVTADKVKAAYKDGILTITLPKSEEAKPKQINVSVN
ncbi:MAG TPA: Hsp20/alpha crystallin family protein [Verrucomicrobiota bacterium]|nr:Hsp20/alpha crystallin family protein [Verrucomicrobiota bacterium]HNT15889.1 Hsp20/alpha crystallin family protein [Verrucomicrobiota bacterium]